MYAPPDVVEYRKVIRAQEKCDSEWLEASHIDRRAPSGRTIWAGDVHTFVLYKETGIFRAFAWRGLARKGDTTIYVVPEGPQVQSAQAALDAAMRVALEHGMDAWARGLRKRYGN